jgi:glycosyltransferase involved in cell wall biosynthesis
LADIAASAESAGHAVTLISPQDFALDFVASAAPGARLVRLKGVENSGRSRLRFALALLGSLPGLRAALARVEVDLLHVNNGGYPGSDWCRLATLAARLGGAPRCLLTVHSAPWSRDTSLPALQAIADSLVWRSVDAVHATTAFVAADLQKLRGMPASLGRHIPYGVAEPAGSGEAVAALRERLAPGGESLLVGMVSATGDHEKGHAVFAEALARAGGDIHAVIVGPHPGPVFVELLHRLGIAHRVALEGLVHSTEVGPYLRASDVLVVPSTAYESLPLVVLEAMAAGKPVFASRLSVIPEAVLDRETGRLFTPGSVEELATLVQEARRAPDTLVRMGLAANERWKQQFSPTAMTTSMLALYEKLNGGPGFTSA